MHHIVEFKMKCRKVERKPCHQLLPLAPSCQGDDMNSRQQQWSWLE